MDGGTISRRIILVQLATVPEFFGFFHGQISYFKDKGFEYHAVSSPGELLHNLGEREKITVHPVTIPRFISPLKDLRSLYQLFSLFRRLNPTIVHAHTPKGGLLGILAAKLAQAPIVIYGMHGTRFLNEVGFNKYFFIFLETIMGHLADRIIAVSFSNKERAIAANLCKPDKIVVIGSGSTNGVDASGRFNPAKFTSQDKEAVRSLYKIPADGLVLGFISRIVRFKGIVELAKAWEMLRNSFPNLYLLLVGWIEEHDPIPRDILENLQSDARVRFTGQVKDTAPLYAAMDIFAYPSHREGFPVSPLEAAAMELPVVTTSADGCREATVDGITGIIVPPGDHLALAEAIKMLLVKPDLRKTYGEQGRKWVLENFQPEIIWEGLYKNYMELLKEKELV